VKPKLNICIVGGGNSAHSLIPLLSSNGHNIYLLTRKPELWSTKIIMEYTDENGYLIEKLEGQLCKISANPAEVVSISDVVILCLPVSKYRLMLNKIAPYIDKTRKIFVGTIYGQGGFNWMMEQIIQDYSLNNVSYFAIGLVPWITRTKQYGYIGINYGSKYTNVVAVKPASDFDELNYNLLNDICYNYFKKGLFKQSSTFLALTLSVDNQIIHLSRLYGLYLQFGGHWDKIENVPYFYRDFDEKSADIMRALDADYCKIRNKIKEEFPQYDFSYMLDYLSLERLSYNSANTDIRESFINSSTLVQIPTPVIKAEDGQYIFDKNHRFFTDDLYYGLVIAKWFAEHLNISTPMLNEIINWAQDFIGDTVMVNNKLITPQNKQDFLNGNPDVYEYSQFLDYIF